MGHVQDLGWLHQILGPLGLNQFVLFFSTKCGLQRIIINLELKILTFDLAMEGPKFNESDPNLVHKPQFSIFRFYYLISNL